MKLGEAINLIYDGQCRFCIRALAITRALDVLRVVRFYDAHDLKDVETRFPMLRGADFDEAMYAVTESRRVYQGFWAFRRLVWSSPLMWPLAVLFYFPGWGFLEPRIYAWIARNRANFGCRGEACALPAQPGTRQAGENGGPEP